MSEIIKIKKIDFFHVIDNRFNTYLDNVSGHGVINTQNNQIFTGEILNPTGLQPAIFYKTGVLNGTIQDGSGFYNWSNVQLIDVGTPTRVYLNYVTGYHNSENQLEFIDITGSGLLNGDIINIADYTFNYNSTPQNINEFNSPSSLLNILNSGATGAFNDQGFALLESLVGVTGYQINNILYLKSYLRNGLEGNNIRIYKDTSDVNAIKIKNRYFTGGQDFRPRTDSWVGMFSGTFDVTVENSGFYIKKVEPIEIIENITGIVWEDNFSGNYTILTGLKDPRNPRAYSGISVPFNSGLNQFSGRANIPLNQSTVYTGLNIEILKPNPYNISGNRSEYMIIGDDIFYTGIIEG